MRLKTPDYHNPCEKCAGCTTCGCVYDPNLYEAECPHGLKRDRELGEEKPPLPRNMTAPDWAKNRIPGHSSTEETK